MLWVPGLAAGFQTRREVSNSSWGFKLVVGQAGCCRRQRHVSYKPAPGTAHPKAGIACRGRSVPRQAGMLYAADHGRIQRLLSRFTSAARAPSPQLSHAHPPSLPPTCFLVPSML